MKDSTRKSSALSSFHRLQALEPPSCPEQSSGKGPVSHQSALTQQLPHHQEGAQLSVSWIFYIYLFIGRGGLKEANKHSWAERRAERQSADQKKSETKGGNWFWFHVHFFPPP